MWVCVCVCVCRMVMFNLLESHSNTLSTHKLQKKFQDSLLLISRAPSSSGANHSSKPTLPIGSSNIIWNIWHWQSVEDSVPETNWLDFKNMKKHKRIERIACIFIRERNRHVTHDNQTVDHHVTYIQWSSPQWSGPYAQNLITNCDHKVRPKSAKLRGQCNGALPTVWKQEASNATRLNLTNLSKKNFSCCWKLSFYSRDSLEIRFYILAVGWKTKHFLLKKWFSVITALGNSTSYYLSAWQSPKGVQFFW